MATLEAAHIYGVQIRESANDGSDFSNADTDYRILFVGEDGLFHLKDASGTITTPTGMADPMTTRGDLIVRNSSNVTARLATGAAGTVLRGGTDPSYGFPPGYEFDYTQITSSVNVTSTTAASPDNIVTSGSVTYDGSTVVIIEFYASNIYCGIGGNNMFIDLWEDSTRLGQIAHIREDGTTGLGARPIYVRRRLTPSNASHTYSIKAWFDFANTSTRQVVAGAGSGPAAMPAYIRVSKV